MKACNLKKKQGWKEETLVQTELPEEVEVLDIEGDTEAPSMDLNEDIRGYLSNGKKHKATPSTANIIKGTSFFSDLNVQLQK